MIPIIFSGPAASGKSSAAKAVSEKLKIEFYDGGDILKLLAKDMGYNVDGDDFWDTKEGMEFFKIRKSDPSFDHKVDEKFKEILNEGNCIVTSWTMPWLYDGKSIKVYVTALPDIRAERMSGRDGMNVKEALKVVEERDNINKELFSKLYDIDIVSDMKPFDIVLDTSNMNREEVVDHLVDCIKNLINVRI